MSLLKDDLMEGWRKEYEKMLKEYVDRLFGDVDKGKELDSFNTPDKSHWPHVCPRCGDPAYIGINKIDCSRFGCK